MADNEGATTHDAALWWLNSNQAMWGDWVTGDAAAAISAALSSNEIPDGWPDE